MAAPISGLRSWAFCIVTGIVCTVIENTTCTRCKHRVPDRREVIYQVYLEPSRITRRSIDQHLRIKIVYDLSIEYLPVDKNHLVKGYYLQIWMKCFDSTMNGTSNQLDAGKCQIFDQTKLMKN
ncbi:uncharacterized protein LOC125483503 isoform X3 [Rhincodon typus]|uniref:uncharacterized protein LOC125483503 isoform X3 n=1 Tax=Rhincodon typus TaxID=259920 RepID=UPI00202F3874|nr:uncharacterized protein LOC125483503 isoform X3 [Rhincodon typus]